MGYPILTAIIVTPLVGALLVLCTPARRPDLAKAFGLITSMATLGFAAQLLWRFQTNFGGFQFLGQFLAEAVFLSVTGGTPSYTWNLVSGSMLLLILNQQPKKVV